VQKRRVREKNGGTGREGSRGWFEIVIYIEIEGQRVGSIIG
jgi:hypothetical protein